MRISLYTICLSILILLFEDCALKGQNLITAVLEILYFPKNCARHSHGENGQVLNRLKEKVSDEGRGYVAILL